jgi:hypothetical protein
MTARHQLQRDVVKERMGRTLLSELGLSLFDGGHHHVAGRCGGESVQAGAEADDGDDVEV